MTNNTKLHKADFQIPENGNVRCVLCPHYCVLHEGQSGICGVRSVQNGVLVSNTYGYPAALQIDPIEKKPLFHFLPGTHTFSIGTQGCNLECKFCQNWHLSMQHGHLHEYLSAEDIMKEIRRSDCQSIAFTYNEPIVFSEYALDIIKLAKKDGYPCIFVTNAYISEEARPKIFSQVDAANIDLKAFSDETYRKYTGASLQPVLDTISWCIGNKIHTEITCLLIPGVNDDNNTLHKVTQWIYKHCGADTPVHMNAFHPDYKMMDHPMTPRKTLERARTIALGNGLHYVYVGNYPFFDNNTYCPVCGETVIERKGYQITLKQGHEHPVAVQWSDS